MKNLLLLSTLFLSTVSMNALAAATGEGEGDIGRKSPVPAAASVEAVAEGAVRKSPVGAKMLPDAAKDEEEVDDFLASLDETPEQAEEERARIEAALREDLSKLLEATKAGLIAAASHKKDGDGSTIPLPEVFSTAADRVCGLADGEAVDFFDNQVLGILRKKIDKVGSVFSEEDRAKLDEAFAKLPAEE